MPRTIGKLSTRRVATAKPKAGRRALVLADGGNLYLQATLGDDGNVRRSWTFRYALNGKRREMGLGPTHTLGLAEARDKARSLRQQLLEDIDPLEAREVARREKIAEQARTVTFKECARMYLDLHQDGWSRKHSEQWHASLKRYIFPVLGSLAVADIDQASVLKVVKPIWKTKTVTASRCRGRIEAILEFVAAHKFRGNDYPARHITVALPKKSKIAKVEHFTALGWQDIPAFMSDLRNARGIPARCLEFLVLTAARRGEALGATWDEIKDGVWTIPASRMKAGQAHRIPLSARVLEILRSLPKDGQYLFGGSKPLPEQALRRGVLARLRPGVTIHGFRAPFEAWADQQTPHPPHVCQHALARTPRIPLRRA